MDSSFQFLCGSLSVCIQYDIALAKTEVVFSGSGDDPDNKSRLMLPPKNVTKLNCVSKKRCSLLRCRFSRGTHALPIRANSRQHLLQLKEHETVDGVSEQLASRRRGVPVARSMQLTTHFIMLLVIKEPPVSHRSCRYANEM